MRSLSKLASIVAIDALAALMPLLGFQAQRRHRPRVEALHADGLARLLAIAVGAILDALKSRVYFRDQFALPVAGAKLDSAVGLVARAIRNVGVLSRLLQGIQGLFTFPEDFFPPSCKFFSKVSALALIHEWFVFRRLIIWRQIYAAHVAPYSHEHPY